MAVQAKRKGCSDEVAEADSKPAKKSKDAPKDKVRVMTVHEWGQSNDAFQEFWLVACMLIVIRTTLPYCSLEGAGCHEAYMICP